MSLLHIGGGSGSSIIPAEGVDFDGTNDYLSRSTDLVGNVDSKTFTFSAWVYVSDYTTAASIIDTTSSNFRIRITSSTVQIQGKNSAGTVILNASVASIIPLNTWCHIYISIDLANTSNRYIYVNNILTTPTWTTYTNDFIDFTNVTHRIGRDIASVYLKGRLSNVFLDYTYRDLSIEANRRLFITADGKPTPMATLKALNPILYLPLKDSATATQNEGTGGNFTLNGTIATSNRGANQDNCKASYFDGVNDYLSSTVSLGTIQAVTISVVVKNITGANHSDNIINIGGNENFIFGAENGNLSLVCENSSSVDVVVLNTLEGGFEIAKTYHICLSFDLSDSNKKHLFVNGVETSPSVWTTYAVGQTISLSSPIYIGRDQTTGKYWYGNIGELYFDTNYIDLATNNPFWDAVENKPVPVRKVMADTGVTPLIAMPLYASNAGNNYGTGGDFTANSAPYVGARGGSEFWARSAKFNGGSGFLNTSNISTQNSKSFSGMFVYENIVANSDVSILNIWKTYSSNFCLQISLNSAEQLAFLARNSSNTTILNQLTEGNTLYPTAGGKTIVLFSIDLGTGNKSLYVYRPDGNSAKLWNAPTVFTNDFIRFSEATNCWVNGEGGYATPNTTGFSSIYFTTDYVDFSQESNRNKFVNQLGYPRDLQKEIEAGNIPTPLIYLPFDDPSNLGKNLGTGGNFTVNGTVTAGADFSL